MSDKIWDDACREVRAEMADKSRKIEVDIAAALEALQSSPELAAQMTEIIGGPALVEAQAENDRLVATLKSILGQLEGGFVRCEHCGEQEDTKDMDVVYEIRETLKPYM